MLLQIYKKKLIYAKKILFFHQNICKSQKKSVILCSDTNKNLQMELTPDEIERRRLLSRITKRFHKACADFALIEEGDHILIGLSGGKDSLALVELLGRRAQIFVPRFRVTAVHVSVTNIGYQSDSTYLEDFCREHRVEYRHIETSYEEDPSRAQKNHCFLCSWYRRKALFNLAQELGCNKIALGHHKDDIVQTLLMNMISQGSLQGMPPKLQMDKMPLQLIRPLCLNDEKDIARYAELSGYKKVPKLCPYEHDSTRTDVRHILEAMERINPNAKDSIMTGLGY